MKNNSKLNSLIAIICVVALVVGFFGENTFFLHKTRADSGTYFYFDASNLSDAANITSIVCQPYGWATPVSMTAVPGYENLYRSPDVSTGYVINSGQEPLCFAISVSGGAKIYSATDSTSLSAGNTLAVLADRVFRSSATSSSDFSGSTLSYVSYQDYLNSLSHAGDTINFVDMTKALSGTVNAVFYSEDGSAYSTSVAGTLSSHETSFTVPADATSSAPYMVVEFTDSSNNSLGRYSIGGSVSDATAVVSGYDESSTNTYYYGCTQNSDSTVTSIWGSAPTTSSISPSKLYLDSLTFIVDASLTPTITIGDGSAQTISADASDSTTYSVDVSSSSIYTDTIISVSYNGTTYNFMWTDSSYNLLEVISNLASVSKVYSTARTIFFDAALSKLSYDGSTNDEFLDTPGVENIMPVDNGNIYAVLYTELPVHSGKLYIDASNISDVDYIDSIELKPDGYGVGIALVPMGSGYFESNVDISGYSLSPSSGYIYVKYKDGTTKTSAHYTGYDLKGALMGHIISFTSTNAAGTGISVANASNYSSITLQLTKRSAYTKVISGYSHTWEDVYSADVPTDTTYKYLYFYSSTSQSSIPSNSARTVLTTMPTMANQCYYADTSDKYIYDNAYREGYWDTVYSIRDSETGKGRDVVDIMPSDFDSSTGSDKYSQAYTNGNILYINSTFYDYYSDYELNGFNRDEYGSHIQGQRNWVPFRQFDQALSDYYRENATDNPIYTGHFQPSISGWGGWFADVAPTLGLYGFNNYAEFMSTNNSVLDLYNNQGKYSYTSQGLVGNNLVNNQIMTRNSSVSFSDYTATANNTSTSASLPHFDADFLNGNNSKNTKVGDVYENVAFPFNKYYMDDSKNVSSSIPSSETGIYYWVFDSSQTTLALRENSNRSNSDYDYYLKDMSNTSRGWTDNVNSASETSGVSTTYGFFPFNETSTANTASTYNYGFGTKMEFQFSLTSDGTVKGSDGKYYPIEFRFSGDDDVWVYIDDKLVLDVGGSHGQVSGVLDFSNDTVKVTNVKNGEGRTGIDGVATDSFSMEGSKAGKHKITIFYMERGMWESNMKFMFNFTDSNDLQVTKSVDTTTNNVSDEFKNLFLGSNLYTFNIKNQATHYGAYSSSGATITPISFATDFNNPNQLDVTSPNNIMSYTSSYTDSVSTTYSDVALWHAQEDNTNREYTDLRLGVIYSDSGGNVDITDMRYLTFRMCYNGDNPPVLANTYVKITYSDNSTAYGWLSGSMLYGSNSLTKNVWSYITVDLTEMEGYNPTNTDVTSISIQYDEGVDIYFDDFVFKPSTSTHVTGVGFTVKQDEISDYGSATSGDLENTTGAVYTFLDDSSGTSYTVDDKGEFVIGGNDTVVFKNQFRRGSYISLTEILSTVDSSLFDTKYTISEFDSDTNNYVNITDNLLGVSGSSNTAPASVYSRYGSGSLSATGSSTSLVDLAGTSVEDYRVEVYNPAQANTGYTSSTDTSEDSIVFRSYLHPDEDYLSLDLKVNQVNIVKTGGISITKSQATTTDTALNSNSEYTFYVVYDNVGGRSLETANIVRKITLKNGETWTSDGIPVGTAYTIYEAIPTDGSSIQSINGSTAYSTLSANTTLGTEWGTTTPVTLVAGTPYISGIVEEAVSANYSAYNFANTINQTVNLALTKKWTDIASVASLPSAHFKLRRKVNGAADSTYVYVPVTYDTSTSSYKYDSTVTSPTEDNYVMELTSANVTSTTSSNSATWTINITGLDKYTDDSLTANKISYVYDIVEVVSNGTSYEEVSDSSSVTLGGDTYKVTYGTRKITAGSVDANNVSTYTMDVTNTYQPPSYVLPMTGGKGYKKYLIFGYLLVLIALAGFAYRNKNRSKNPDYIYGKYKF